MKYLAFIIFIFLASTQVYAQNYLFAEEISGLHLATSYSSKGNFKLYTFEPGYTINGRLTLELIIGNEKNKTFDLNITSFKPAISYLFLKQKKGKMPVSATIGANYQYNSKSDINPIQNTIMLKTGVFHTFKASSLMSLIVGGNMSIARRINKVESFNMFNYGIQATALYKIFYLTPVLNYIDGESLFTLKVGIIFPSKIN